MVVGSSIWFVNASDDDLTQPLEGSSAANGKWARMGFREGAFVLFRDFIAEMPDVG